jgi:hypothetical protein
MSPFAGGEALDFESKRRIVVVPLWIRSEDQEASGHDDEESDRCPAKGDLLMAGGTRPGAGRKAVTINLMGNWFDQSDLEEVWPLRKENPLQAA